MIVGETGKFYETGVLRGALVVLAWTTILILPKGGGSTEV